MNIANCHPPPRYSFNVLKFFLPAHGNRTVRKQRDGWPGKGRIVYSDVQHSCHCIRPVSRDLDGVGAIWQQTFDQPISRVVAERVPRACVALWPYLNSGLGGGWGVLDAQIHWMMLSL